MAFRDIQSSIVIDTLLSDLVQEAIDQRLRIKDSSTTGPCQRLFDILGLLPCSVEEEDVDVGVDVVALDEAIIENSAPNVAPSGTQINKQGHHWHSWLVQALAADSSEDELDIYRRKQETFKQFSHTACQTDQPRFRKRSPSVATPGDRELLAPPAPCELTRQTIFIDAIPAPAPNVLGRPPLADRFCYMLTDFASALYCSLAIMCCCTPSMFR